MANDLEAPKPFVPSGFTDGNKLDAGGIEQMRFGLAGSGPLAKAVLDSNVVGARIQLGLGASAIAGIISMYGGTVLPAGYLWCDGLAYDKAVYPGLFTALGVNRYGVDTATQFFLPNLTSHLPRGAATTGGAVTTNNNNTHGHNVNATTVGDPTITVTNNNPTTSLAHNHNNNVVGVNAATTNAQTGPQLANTNAGVTSSDGNHNHNNNGTTTVGGSNRNVAAGNTAGVANSGHQHTVGGTSTGSTGGHNHNNNAVAVNAHNHSLNTTNAVAGSTSSDGGTLAHTHANTATATQGTVTTGTVIDNLTYVPAFVEVNYIIKT